MIPGMNPRQLKQAMKKMGISQEDLDATEVIIKLHDKEIIIDNPSVQRVNMGGNESFQISGNVYERQNDTTPDIEEEDIQMVVDQTGVSREVAFEALKECEGDIARTILELQDEK